MCVNGSQNSSRLDTIWHFGKHFSQLVTLLGSHNMLVGLLVGVCDIEFIGHEALLSAGTFK